jgi:hypothetical protein
MPTDVALKTRTAKRGLPACGSLPRHLPKMTAAWPPASSSTLLWTTPKVTRTARMRVHFHDTS